MSRARELAKLGNTDALGIDGVDLRAGSVSKGTNLDVATDVKVVGVVTATNFFGEGSGLTGLAAVGAGVTVMRENNSIGAATKINFDEESMNRARQKYGRMTEQQLDDWGCRYTKLFLGKYSGDIYIDDKGIHSDTFFNAN